MKYGIICAVDEEIRYIREDMTNTNIVKIARREYIEGDLYGQDVVLVMSLVGKVAAAATATTLINMFKVDKIIFCGTAGGIDKALNVGDVVVADKLVQHDVFDGVEYFKIPRLNVAYFEADKILSKAMYDGVAEYLKEDVYKDIPKAHMDEFHIKAPKVMVGTIASGDQFINDKSKNKWLEDNIDNLKCVEMEGAAVAQVCYEFEIQFAVIRVISDSANEESGPAFDKFALEAMPYFTRGSLKAFLQHHKA